MKIAGMNAQTGRRLAEHEHLQQSITDILFTPVGSRVMRRNYGSLLLELIDQPKNAALRLKIMSACYLALLQWEPRVRLQSIDYQDGKDGHAHIMLFGVIVGTRQPIQFSLPVR